jgi:hypothetical protein
VRRRVYEIWARDWEERDERVKEKKGMERGWGDWKECGMGKEVGKRVDRERGCGIEVEMREKAEMFWKWEDKWWGNWDIER